MSKYGDFSRLYYPVFGLNTGKYGPEKLCIWTTFTQSQCTQQTCVSLQHVFSVTIFRLPRRLESVLKTSRKDEKLFRWRRLEDVLQTYLGNVLKTCLEDVLKTCLEDPIERNKILTGDVTNLNIYLTNLYFLNLYLAILRRIQNALITTQ